LENQWIGDYPPCRSRESALCAQWRGFCCAQKADLDRADFARQGWASALNAQAIFTFWEEIVPDIFADI